MSWEKEAQEIEIRRQLAKQQGGEEAIAKHHSRGKYTIRERIDKIVDANSFNEHGQGTGSAEYDDNGEIKSFTPANYVVGLGKINQRLTVVGGEDFTLKGGSPNAAGLRKSVYAEQLAVHFKVPLVRFLEGGGGSVGGSGGGRGGANRGPAGSPVFSPPRFRIIAEAMATVPIASAAVGAVAGFPAGRLVASHFSVMTEKTAQVLVAGPAVVERALGRNFTKEELGSAAIHAQSGVVDNIAVDEEDAFAQIRQFLSYMPDNVWSLPKATPCHDPRDRREPRLINAVPKDRREPFDMTEIIRDVLDQNSYFEIAEQYGRGIITALGRLGGHPVGILANDCRYFAGAMTAQGAQKARRLIELCDTFHLPVINFVDEPGFMIGLDSERAGTIRYGMAAVMAAAHSTVPWASVLVHKSFGVASAAHFGPNAYVLAWPSSESGALPVEGGVAVAYRREIEAADDPAAKRREIEERLSQGRTPFPRAESFSIHELIDPRDTRPYLYDWMQWNVPLLDTLKHPVHFPIRP